MKTKVKPVSYYSKQADKKAQELFKLNHKECEVCGREMSCGHHYYPKSSAGNLRYNWLNWIAICQGCHFSHHNGNPDIHNTVNKQRGLEWLVALQAARRIPNYECNTKSYYKQKAIELQELIDNFE